ncbi:MAG: DUF3108 domain-containing protein [Nitrosomonadales bacterium]|nr:DUF3108 domain-containing protein [Nitrosomonadales bacterium]
MRPYTRRFAFTLLLSVLIHGLLLWRLPLQLPDNEPPLHLLEAKLERLPAHPAPPKVQPPKAKQPAAPVAVPSVVPVIPATPPAPEATPGTAEEPSEAQEKVAALPPPPPVAAIAQEAPPLPKNARLKFAVRLKEDGVTVGESIHTLEIGDGHYKLKTSIRTIGLARLFKTIDYSQFSRGIVSKQGLQPEYATEDKAVDGITQTAEMFFERDTKRLRFSLGGETALPEDAQDRLSLLYQLSRLELGSASLPLAVTNGRKLERYQVEIGPEEEIMTPMGKLRTIALRKIHGPGEEGLNIWLALEYRLLPVKVIRINRNGEEDGAMLISEIRLSDE